MAASASTQVGSLCEGLPAYMYDPPVEAVVFGFGVNEDGQLGLDTDANVLTPKVVEALLGTRFSGRDFRTAPLVAGSRNTLAIDADGHVLAFGWNARGSLGHGHHGNERKPRRVVGLKGAQVVQVALGGWHALALDAAGQVYGFGGNEYGQVSSDIPERDVVHPAACLSQLRVKQVAAGGMHSLALTEHGQLWMWGEPWGDFSMHVDRRPRRLDHTGDFVGIACGAFHNLALNAAGECFTWGINDFGQLGNGTTSYATEPQCVVGLEDVFLADIAAGGWHSMAISSQGEVYVWGRGEYGRLGIGDRSGRSLLRPQKVRALEGHRVVEGACGGSHSLAISDEGRCFLWGRGGFGRLGTGGERDHYTPVELKLPGGPERWRVISAAAGGRHTLALALPDNGDLEARQRAWSMRKPYYGSPSPPSSTIGGRNMSWTADLADDEAEAEGGSVDGRSVDGASAGAEGETTSLLPYEEEGGPIASVLNSQVQHDIERLRLQPPSTAGDADVLHAAAGGMPSLSESPDAQRMAAEAAAVAMGLRDDTAPDRP
eukprot:scaffold18.g1925.t1